MVTRIEPQFTSDLPIPPGELLEEELALIGMTQQQLAIRTGRPAQVINEIIRGKKQITFETAIELEKVLGIPAHIWVNLEAEYRLTQARLKEREDLSRQEHWLKQFPVGVLEKRGWINKFRNRSNKTRELLEFLGVASFDAWRQTMLGFRITNSAKVSQGALAAWLRRGELEGLELNLPKYDEKKFNEAVRQIRMMTSLDPSEFVPRMTTLCADAGVAVIFVQELPKSGANGAARWLTPTKGLIQMSLRLKWHDIFWFSFFHEVCHIRRHKIHEVYIDVDGINGTDVDPIAEEEADAYARDLLIASDDWFQFRGELQFTEAAVRKFAAQIGIHPGIVVGRLQHDKIIPFSSALTRLKERLEWPPE